MASLILRNATLPDGRTGVDILCTDGKIAAVGPRLDATADATLDARGLLVSPPFVDAHFHIDSTLTYGMPRVNASGTPARGHRAVGSSPTLTQEAIAGRALAYCDLAVSKGLLAIRSHVDTSDTRPPGRRGAARRAEAREALRRSSARSLPQDARLRSPGALHSLKRALAMGVDVVGGIPHFERTMADGESVRVLCEIGGPGQARRHALRRERRPAFAPRWTLAHQRAAAQASRAGGRVAPDVDALDGQLLRVEADSADEGGGTRRDREPADQHHAAGASRHVSQASRHDARARVDGRGRAGRVRPRLRDGPVVSTGAAPTCSRSRRWDCMSRR
jgi:hypothetical protein